MPAFLQALESGSTDVPSKGEVEVFARHKRDLGALKTHAEQSVVNDLTVVTANDRDFRWFQGVVIANWMN